MYIGHDIDGIREDAEGRRGIDVLSPTDGHVVGTVVAGDASDVDRAVTAARGACDEWSHVPMHTRIRLVGELADALERRREPLAQTLTAEMGAPISFARAAQVGVAIADLKHLIAAAKSHCDREAVSNSLVLTEPVGVVAAITPWNFPLHQIMLKIGAAVLAGCTVVLKPSEVAPLNAAVIGDLVREIGLPPGVLNIVHGTGTDVGGPLAAHPGIDMVTFTGSRAVGESVARAAASNITKVALELGGKSAAIVLDDADIDVSVTEVLSSCFSNAGQTCAALTRALVPKQMYQRWVDAAVDAAKRWGPDDPSRETTTMGPLASREQGTRVRSHIQHAIDDGARMVLGDRPESITDAFVAPTIFADVTPDMRVFREEIFGPVLAITPYETVDDAIALANDSDYGLSGGVWSGDPRRALAVATRMRTGTVGINGAGLDVGAPFGGYKQSGVGRECGTRGLDEFFEVKTVMGAAALITTTHDDLDG